MWLALVIVQPFKHFLVLLCQCLSFGGVSSSHSHVILLYLICKTENVRILCFGIAYDFVLDLEMTCMFDLGRRATEQWETGEELLGYREGRTCMHARERLEKKGIFF